MSFWGNKNKFAIEYKLIKISDKIGEFGSSYGEFSIYCNGVNILSYKNNKKYECYLISIIEWFACHLIYILNDDPYPLKELSGNYAYELYNNFFKKFDIDKLIELELSGKLEKDYYEINQEWYFNHSIFHANSGCNLANVFFRKINNNIEISWNNNHLKNVHFLSYKGACYIDMNLFEKIIFSFMIDFVIQLKNIGVENKYLENLFNFSKNRNKNKIFSDRLFH